MKRSVLVSLMLIGAVIAVVAGASTFSAFMDSATGTSDMVTAGTVDVVVNSETDDVFDWTWSTGTHCNPGKMAPPSGAFTGDVCTQQLTINNAGTLAFTYTVAAKVEDDEDPANLASCFKVYLARPDGSTGGTAPSWATVNTSGSNDVAAVGPISYIANSHLAATQSQVWQVSVILLDDNTNCNAADIVGIVTVTVVATQSENPHNN